MTNPTPRDRAQPDEDGNVQIQTGPNSWIGVSADNAQAVRDAIQGKAAGVVPVGRIDRVEWCPHHQKWRHDIWSDKKINFGAAIYASAPPSTASVPDRLIFSARHEIAEAAGVGVTAETNAVIAATLAYLRAQHPTPSPAQAVDAVEHLDSILHDLEHGFVRCERCGSQEDTKTMDIVPMLKELRAALAARAGQVAAPAMVPLDEAQLTACLVQSSCVGTVKMSFESGPYEIDRPSINADRLCRAIEAASAKLNGLTVGGSNAGGGADK